MKEEKKLVVLVDTHAILHRGYHALPDFRSSKNEPTGAIYGLIVFLLKIIKDTNPHAIIACYDLPGGTHRHEAFADYKGTRKKIDDDLIFQINESRLVLEAFGIPVVSAPGFEADDCLGTLVEKLKKNPELDILIASGDMDTFQLISGKQVRVYTLKKGIKDTIVYDEDMVKERFGFGPELLPDYKGLRGDVSDNIPGIKGIGEKTASDIISKFGTLEEVYASLKKNKEGFEKAGIKKRMVELLEAGEEEAFFSKMLATIRRDAPVDAVVPEESWQAHVDTAKLKELCTRFEFRDVPRRIDEVIKKTNGESPSEEAAYPVLAENIPSDELEKAKAALFVLDSDKTNPNLEDILSYTGCERFADAKEKLLADIESSGLSSVYYEIEVPLVPVLRDMRETGIQIDRKYLANLSKEYHTELSALEQKIYTEAGEEFNINSPKQLGEILFTKMGLAPEKQKKTAGGAVSTRESELVKIKDAHPIVPAILEYREIQKILSTYVDTIPEFIDMHGRIHPTLIQTGAVTGRMASENPSIQNIPIKSERGQKIRNAFTVKEGSVLIDVDYSQVELRIAAFLSNDAELIEIFKSGRDIHTEVAAKVFGLPRESVDKEMRRRAKVINFGILYGMGVTALRENLSEGGADISRAEAEKFRDDYFKTFSSLAKWITDVVEEARERGYTETFFGRRRHFRDLKSKLPFMRAMAERMAVNAPIQGTQADMLKIAMKKIADILKERGLADKAKMIFQVHDELGLEVDESVVPEVAKIVKEAMEGVLSAKDTKGVPIIANVGVGKNWGHIEALK